MQRRISRNFVSVFMAFVLVVTCNSATAQPLAAFAEEGARQAIEVGAEEAPNPEDAPDPVGDAEEPAEAEGGATDDAPMVDVPTEDGEQSVDVEPADPTEGDEAPLATAPAEEVPAVERADVEVPAAATRADASDVTFDTAQLSLAIGSFAWKDAAGALTEAARDDKGAYLLPTPFEGIKGLRLVLDFGVLKDDETRTIKQGDHFTFALNQTTAAGLNRFSLTDTVAPQNITFGGHLVATYEIKHGVLNVTFSQNVNYEEGFAKINGGISLNFELNEAAYGTEDETGVDLVLQDVSNPAHVVVPPKSSTVDGVEKEGVYDPATRSITWTVRAGTSSAGLDMAGMKIVDTYDAGALEYVSASTTAADGTETDITTAIEQGTGSCSYAFPAGSVAPQTVKIVTKVKDAALPKDGASVVGNDVRLDKGTSPYDPGTHRTAGTTTSVPGMGVQKNGEQIDGNKMQWSIVVNEAEDAWLWNAVVTDVLAANLTYLDNSLRVDGKAVPVYDAVPDMAPASDYATLVTNADGTHTLAFHFVDTEADDHDGKPLIGKAHRLTFETALAGDGIEDAKIENTATLSGGWPDGDGPGVAFARDMGIGTEYRYAFVKKEGSVEQRTGVITWSVNPQTRLEHYEGATLSDAIDASDQAFIDGTVMLKYRETTYDQAQLVKEGWLTVTGSGVAGDPTTLAFTLPKDPFPLLSDVQVTYRTQATAGFLDGTHGTAHTYRNTANLEVQTSGGTFENAATAEVPLENDLIAKTAAYEYDDAAGRGWLHYTLTANANKMDLSDVAVSDDFSHLATTYYKDDGSTLDIPATAWTIDEGRTQVTGGAHETPTFTDGRFSVKLGEAASGWKIDGTYTIDLYLTLTDAARQAYLLDAGSGFIRTKNVASIEGTSGGGAIDRTAVYETTPEGGDIVNELVDKSSQFSKDTGVIRWRVDVNPQGAELKNAVVKDVLNKSLQLDFSSVRLYESRHAANGSIADDDPATAGWTEVKDDAFTVEPGDDGSSILRAALPDGAKAYTLVYETNITEAVTSGYVQNRASLLNDDTEKGDGSHTQELGDDSWGYLERTASYKFVKMDALGGSAQPLGAGVTFGLFADEACMQQIKLVTANEHGAFGFYGLTPGTTYWYKETKAPAGYVLDTTAHELAVPAGVSGVQPGAITVTNDRVRASAPVTLTKLFETTAGSDIDKQARFKLVLRPLGTGSGKAVGVSMAGSAGTYVYAGTEASVDTATELVVDAAAGVESATLALSDLPWGSYELRETGTTAGYALQGAAKTFTVAQDGSVTFGDAAGTALTNGKTHITLHKLLNGIEQAVPGVSFSLFERTNGSVGTTAVESLFTKDAYTWTPDGNPWEIVGLPAGAYTLRETTAADDATISQVQDVPFTIAADGALKLDKGVAHVKASGTTITVDNVSCSAVKLDKLDQYGHAVSGAGVQLQRWDGSAWVDEGASAATAGRTLTFDKLQRATTYRIVEALVPDGYLTAQPVEFTVNAYGVVEGVKLGNAMGTTAAYGNVWSNGAFTLRDERILGHASFVKVAEDAAGTPLAGATFDLYRVETSGDVKVHGAGSFTSDAQGRVSTVGSSLANVDTGQKMAEGLAPGTYYFKETGAPAGYRFDATQPATSERFTVEADGSNRYTQAAGAPSGQHVIGLAAVENTPLAALVLVHKADEGGSPLGGAVFALTGTDADGSAVSLEAETGADGLASFEHVPTGSYEVRETKPPAGYRLSAAVLKVTVGQETAGLTYDLNVDAPVVNELNSLTVSKVDEAGAPLAGAVFALEGTFADGSSDPLVWTSGTDVETIAGKLVASNVYRLVERSAPLHYVRTYEPREAMMDAHGALFERAVGASAWSTVQGNALVVANDPVRGQVEVTKTVSGGNGTVAGVQFDLFKRGAASDGDDLAIASACATDAAGVWRSLDEGATNPDTGRPLSEGLAAGSYFLVETKAAPDTELDATPRDFEIADADHYAAAKAAVAVSLENRAFGASLELAKRDATSGAALAGAAFALTYVPEGGDTSQVIVVPATGDAGAYRVDDLKKGTYALEETIVPNGYEQPFKATFSLTNADNGATVNVRDDAAQAVAVTKTAGTWDASGVTNARTLGSLALTKVGEQNEPLAGVLFLLERSEAGAWSTVGTYATGVDGTLVVSDLAWGAYRISETKAAPGYEPGGSAVPIAFEVGPNSGTDVKLTWDHGIIANERTSIAIEKVDDAATPQRLDGAHLKLKGVFADRTTEKAWESSADAAEVLTGQLVVGETYTLEETERLPGYLALPGAIAFALNGAGQIVLESAPVYGDGSQAARLSADGVQLSVRNVKVRGVVTLSKMDADAGTPLDGAVFALYDGTGALVRDGLETGRAYAAADWSATDAAAGRLSIEGLDLGSYSLRETAAEGYQVPDTAYPFTIDNDNATKAPSCDLGTIVNRQTELSFVKTGLYAEQCSDPVLGGEAPEATRPLAGAVFTAYDDAACTHAAATATSDEAGRVTFKKLPAATYWVRETTTPAGHVPSDVVYVAAFAADGTLSGFVQQDAPDAAVDTVVNDVFRADISMRKVSENDASKVLPNSVYGLYKRVVSPLARGAESLQLIAKATTDEHGMLTFKGVLMDREYVVQELEAPDGSLVSKHPIAMTFAVGSDGAPRLATFDDGSGTAEVDENGVIVWKEPQVMVAFNKKTPEGDALAGALLEVVDERGGVVVEPWTSEEGRGTQVEGVLVAGATYRLVELEAPAGYVRADDVSFTVENPKLGPREGFVQQVDMVDELEAAPPAKTPAATRPFGFLAKTGDPSLALLVGGVVFAAAGIAAASGVRRRRTRT